MLSVSMNGTKHLLLDRRKFLGGAAGLIAAGVLPQNALALAGPYSFKQGAYDVTVVSDGTLLLDLTLFPDAKPEELKALLGAMVQGEKAQFEASPLLLKSGSDVILMDTGSGAASSPPPARSPKASRPQAPIRPASPRSSTPTPTRIIAGEPSVPTAS